ncbi:HNH endonuclease signature motif containing protein [Streptomyces sp. NRRL S-87]|uniref:HNH endonuclease signature motif containing protein n=1 Tax=Streptomyces sp. NRRL S-87 TaxID=1463920 RepID=UPI0004C2AF79|nr:HNH endonuclease signature motif containing protein [Streptomyces sp. NRRL S-87]
MPTSPYTRARLTEAARTSRTLTEALTHLGLDPKSGSRQYIRARMQKLGVDTSHFEREGEKWTREILAEAVAASTTMREVLSRLGLDVVGGHHTHISRKVRAFGIDTSHFRTRSTGTRSGPPKTPEELLVTLEPGHGRVPGDRLRRAMTALGTEERCARCGIEATWRGRPLRLEVDHVDGDWQNNRPVNLRFLCPNCHSTTDSYRGRAKGRRR